MNSPLLLRWLGPWLTLALGAGAAEAPRAEKVEKTPPAVITGPSGIIVSPGQAKALAIFAQRTISSSRQFLLFSPDVDARSRVAGFVEEIKSHVLSLLGEPDRWKFPILLTLDKVTPENSTRPPAELSVFQHEAGLKLQIDVRIGADPARANLIQHVVRALLLEMEYRDHLDLLKPGQPFAEPPWWLVEGLVQAYLRRETGLDPDLFKRLLDANRVPAISAFLAGTRGEYEGGTVAAMDSACALCLVQLLSDQPNGRGALAAFIRHAPESGPDPVVNLLRDFPGLAKDAQSLEKWWTVNLARSSATDRHKGLTARETEEQLTAALRLEIAGADNTKRQAYTLADYESFVKLPATRSALANAQSALVLLGLRASALYRPIIAEYEEVLGLISKGKTRGLKPRLAKLEEIRANLTQRMTGIADYLNWYEASQMATRSGKFDSYLRAAQEIDKPAPRQDPISRYLDALAQEQ